MTLPLTCACGARLEVDESFAGKGITCPDCNRPLVAPPPVKPPTRTSGLALASLLLALVGAFTFVGTLAAIVSGYLALRQIERAPHALGGRRLARAGMILGGVFTILTVAACFTMERFGLDGLLRTLELSGNIEYGPEPRLNSSGQDVGFRIDRPGAAWGRLKASNTASLRGRESVQEMVLFSVWDDAQIVCLANSVDPRLPLEACRQEGLDLLRNSRLVRFLARLRPEDPAPPVGDFRDLKELASEKQEFYIDMRLAGVERTFLVQVVRQGSRLGVVAGGSRKKRFTSLEEQIRAGASSFKLE